jgi:hypothetical protein
MKVLFIFCIAILCLFSNVFAQETEEEKAIVTFVTEAYQALIDRDGEKYIDTWAHEAMASRIGVAGTSINVIAGWENIEKLYKTLLENNPEPGKTVFEYRNFKFNIDDDMAWVGFDKYLKVDDEMKKSTREYRRLVKQDEKWKVLTLMHISQPEPEE